MPSGEKRMLTAAHLFHDGDACNIADHDLVGRNANVYGGNKVGEVATADVSADYVTIEKADGGHWSSKIDNNNSTTHEIKGYVTKDTLKYWTGLSNPPCLHSMGCTTDHTQGEIKATEVSDTGFFSSCLDWDGEGVKTWCTAGSGDSGSPTYHTYWSKEYLVSLTCAHAADVNAVYCNGELKNKGGASWGSGAYHIKNLESNSNGDLQFGTGDYGGI